MKPSQILSSILPSVGPLSAILLSKIGAIDEDPTMLTIASVLQTCADRDNMDVETFVKSGRAVTVLGAMARGVEPQPHKLTADLQMFRCENCKHVHYNISE